MHPAEADKRTLAVSSFFTRCIVNYFFVIESNKLAAIDDSGVTFMLRTL